MKNSMQGQNKSGEVKPSAVIDFKEHLRRQIQFIRNSCELFDRGHVEEAIRIAVSLRVLFHHTGQSISLLHHLGAKSISLVSTAAPFVEEPVIPNLHLVNMLMSINGIDSIRCHCEPILGNSPRNEAIPFQKWWQDDVVIEHKEPRKILARRNLVLTAANMDGGAHVGDKLEPTYDEVRRGSGMEIEFVFKPESGRAPLTVPFENIHYASLRQIGYEVLNSPELIALGQK